MSEHEQWDIVSSVGLTALIVAAGRAVDTHRPDGLIEDPWAERFVAAANPPVTLPVRPQPPADDSEDEAWQMMSGYMGVRTRWFDTTLLEAGVSQVVVLAAGLDCRALRLPWRAGTDLYEVDQPAVLRFKDGVLGDAAPRCRRHVVPVDLRDNWTAALIESGFDAHRPTAWLAEGLLPYLPARAESDLLAAVDRLSAPGSSVTVENFTNLTSQVHDPTFRRLSRRLGVDMEALLHEDDREHVIDRLTRDGWRVSSLLAADVAAGYGRTFDPLTQRLNAKSEFVHATR